MSSSALYHQTIFLPANPSEDLLAVVNDMQALLYQATGKRFSTQRGNPSGDSRGIVLRTIPITPNLKRELFSPEQIGFTLASQGTDGLVIEAFSDKGLMNGIYYYLRELGFRWYFPGKKWSITPRLSSIALNIHKKVSPVFARTTLYGNGGYGNGIVLDKNRDIKDAWETWKFRSMLESRIPLSGHIGERFNQKHKEALTRNPGFLALSKGKRNWSQQAKHCYANKGFMELFTRDRLEAFRTLKSQNRGYPFPWSISVEPADGGGFCESPESRKLGTPSNQVFYAANQVAKAIRREDPNGFVNLYAYNQHADVPDFAIEPNVYVTVIPYSFQRIASPEALLEKWDQKTSKMGIYDYWGITSATMDQPAMNLDVIAKRIDLWQSRGINTLTLETSYSIGAMGLPFYLSAQKIWYPEKSVQGILDEFYRDMFGPAAQPMRKMITRWGVKFENAREIPRAYEDLEEAYRLAKGNKAILARIGDFQAYVRYLQLITTYQRLPKGKPESKRAAEAIVEYVWRIQDRMMVHSHKIHQLMVSREEKGDLAFRNKWAQHKKPNQARNWENIRSISDEQVQATFRKEKSTLGQAEEMVTFSTGFKSQRSRSLGNNNPTEFSINLPNEMAYFATEGDLPIEVEVASMAPNNPNYSYIAFLTVMDADRNEIQQLDLKPFSSRTSLKLKTRPGKPYFLKFKVKGAYVKLRVPPTMALAFHESAQALWTQPQLWFWVPENAKKFAVEVSEKGSFVVVGPDNKVVEPIKTTSDTREFPVGPGQSGKFWKCQSKSNNLKFNLVNLPPYFSINKSHLIVTE